MFASCGRRKAGFTIAAFLCALVCVPASPSYSAQAPAARTNPQIEANELVHEVIRNELKAQRADHTHWRYREVNEKDGRVELREVIETQDGDIDRLMAVNDRPLTLEQQRTENARIQTLLEDPSEVRKQLRKQNKDDEEQREMMESFPDAFCYQYGGTDGTLIKLNFKPNPQFRPAKRQGQVFHHIEGTMWIDPRQKRLAGIEGRLTSEVKFGDGLLGHLDKGGYFSVRMQDVGAGHWALGSLTVKMRGKALFFPINLQQKQRCNDYRQIPADLTLQRGAELLKSTTSAVAQTLSSAIRPICKGIRGNHASFTEGTMPGLRPAIDHNYMFRMRSPLEERSAA